jgi:hypothetical protein
MAMPVDSVTVNRVSSENWMGEDAWRDGTRQILQKGTAGKGDLGCLHEAPARSLFRRVKPKMPRQNARHAETVRK